MVDLEVAMVSVSEGTPLLQRSNGGSNDVAGAPGVSSIRASLFEFLEARTAAGRWYERFMIFLILLNVVAFVLASLFVPEYNNVPWAERHTGLCNDWCDAIWFGNYADNPVSLYLNIGSTSLLELVTVFTFTIEYSCRLWLADLEDSNYSGFMGRLRWIPTFFSMVDLVSTVPFYVDAFLLRDSDLFATSFVRMFRLFRMMRVEGRYGSALTMFDDVYAAQKGILGTALFVGVTTWMTVSSLYYVVERKNLDMIYCGAAPEYCNPDEIDTSLCEIDHWGFTNCAKAGCPGTDEFPEPCYNLFNSIPIASYYALLNLFGEFPLIDQHSSYGQIVGTLTAVVAVAVFALPAGIIGNGLEDVIVSRSKSAAVDDTPIVEAGTLTAGFLASDSTPRGRWYNFLHAHSSTQARSFDIFINLLVVLTALSFMLDTLEELPSQVHILLDLVELISVSIFTIEYVFRVYAIKEDPKYSKPGGRWAYMLSFLSVVDFLSVAPFWLEVALTGRVITPHSDSISTMSNAVKALRLLRILRFEQYTHAFTSFDDVIVRNADVLSVTLFSALMVWVLFAAILYVTERNNPDPEMKENYKTVPHSMWLTLLNLSGEAPLSQYSTIGKIITGILGLFATAIFGIPIGVLGAGFEQLIDQENEDDLKELEATSNGNNSNGTTEAPRNEDPSAVARPLGSPRERAFFNFVNGNGSVASQYFEISIYILIMATITVGVIQTMDGRENDYHQIEWVAVLVFTVEYLFRLIGAGADPEFSNGRNPAFSRLRFMVSFYSIVDLLAIVPFYVVLALPNSFVNEYDQYLRMIRIIRLVKLDKYVPSLTLIDDVIRLKYQHLKVAVFAALSLWVLFSAAMFLCEHSDSSDGIDNLPLYGCDSDCSMENRFTNFFSSLFYTGVHLTGDYPIIEYNWPARFVNFFIVIAAVGVVSIPSGLIASGFVQIVQSKNKHKRRNHEGDVGWQAGDDWYEVSLRRLSNVGPPLSRFGPTIDKWQFAVNEFLNGKQTTPGGPTHWSSFAYASRIFIFLVIILNIIAVLLESVPSIDKAVGDDPGNFFDVFEAISVSVFAIEYILRLFCAPKNREALYSPWVYATTFFGIVDLLSTAPWFVQQVLLMAGAITVDDDTARIFRIFRIFRILQLEDFILAFSKLDNVFRASKDVLRATGLLALIIWVGCGALFYIFEENNPNWRECDSQIPLTSNNTEFPGCYDFQTTSECNEHYPGLCSQKAFVDMPNALYYTAVFLGGEWGVVDFTWPGRLVCLFLCTVGIALYAIPIGTLFDSFGAVLGMSGDEEEECDERCGQEPETN